MRCLPSADAPTQSSTAGRRIGPVACSGEASANEREGTRMRGATAERAVWAETVPLTAAGDGLTAFCGPGL